MYRTALIFAMAIFAFAAIGPGGKVLTVQAISFFVVDVTTDAPDATPGDGICETAGSDCSLRAAIQETNANANPGEADVISFANGGEGNVMNVRVNTALPPITESVTIAGQNALGASCDAPRVLLVSLEPAVDLGSAHGLEIASTAGKVDIGGLQIGGFGGAGVYIGGGTQHSIYCSNLGVDLAGTTASPNGIGVGIRDTSSGILVGITGMAITNIISGNGVGIATDSASGIAIRGNYIGIGADGSAIPNEATGVYVRDSTGITLGMTQLGGGNVISANAGNGVVVESLLETVSNIQVKNNTIGYAPDTTTPLPNGSNGIQVIASGTGTITGVTIGEFAPNSINSIYADGLGHAVVIREVDDAASISGVRIRNNRLVSETGIAINLRPFDESASQVSPPDFAAMDADTGPNTMLNFPLLTSAYSEAFPRLNFLFRTAPFANFSIDFYAVDACGPVGNRSMHRWLGSTAFSADEDGEVNGATGVSGELAVGEGVVAVAVDSQNNTSEISSCVTATLPPPEVGGASPRMAIAGQSGFTMELQSGDGPFAGTEKIVFDGTELTTTHVDSHTLTAFVAASLIGEQARIVQVGVTGVGTFPYFIVRSSSDIDCSGQVTATDSLSLLSLLAGLVLAGPFEACDAPPLPVGDANQSGGTDIADAVHIRGELADLVEPLAGEEEED